MFGYRIVDTRTHEIVPKKDFPFLERAHKLARCISPNEMEELLTGKRHLHRNPRKKEKSFVDGGCQTGVEGVTS
jgi:hypothetical protein